jgi:transcription initiation factor IIE alpha subunit
MVKPMSNLRVINIDTGELKDLSEYRLRHRKQDAAYRAIAEKERYKMTDVGKRWVASYHDPIRAVIKDMSLIEAGAIVKLLPYLRFKSEGKLIKDGKPLKQTDIQRIFKRGKDATRSILDRLAELGVISVMKEGRSNVYFISANFHSMGDVKEGASFTKLYQVKTNEITAKLDLSETGLLYKILPYFHYQTYYLCANPDEQDAQVIRHLNRDRLAEAIGHEPETVSRMMRRLRDAGVIMQQRASRSETYLVHPDLMFRKDAEDEYTRVVRKQFVELAKIKGL